MAQKEEKMKKRAVALLMSAVLAFSMAACGTAQTDVSSAAESDEESKAESDSESTEEASAEIPEETVVIRYGTHWVNDLDPNHVDEVTGEYTMSEANRQASLHALEKIKQELNVEFEFIQYSGDVRNDLMTSVLAGNPVCDLANIWGGAEGTILAQNVLQQLDDYEELFADEESSWMFDDRLYGHYYLLNNKIVYKQRWPLIFNITMLEQIDALKDADGNTITPMDLFLEGNWTWSTFTDYLTKVQAYYGNISAPDGCYADTVQAYETDHRYAGLSAMYATGGMIYGSKGLQPDSEQSIKGAQYIEELMNKGLLTDPGVYDDAYTPRWCEAADHFAKGGTVFTDCPDWWIGGNASSCAERGESIGIVPWPRPDGMDLDDPDYQQVITIGDSVGVLKGVSEERTELALKAYRLYWQEYYKALGGTETVAKYKEQSALTEMAGIGLDVYNESYGEKLIECFNFIGSHLGDDYSDLMGIRVAWDDIIGKSIYGIDGMSAYDVSVKANLNEFTNVISNMETILAGSEIKDNQKPVITTETAAIPTGTAFEDVDWTQYFAAEDSVDGVLDSATATIEATDGFDLNTVGVYEGDSSVKIHISDLSGNEETAGLKVVVYNPGNTAEPVITPKAELPVVAVDTDSSGISWGSDFIDSAVDADGLDISESISADLSELDTTTAGTYSVVITATDYAGNSVSVTLEITVAAE